MAENLAGLYSEVQQILAWFPVPNVERQQEQGSRTELSRVSCTCERSLGVYSHL